MNKFTSSILAFCLLWSAANLHADGSAPTAAAKLKSLGGRWYVLEGDITGADLEKLGIKQVLVRGKGIANASPEDRPGTNTGLLLYRSAGGFVDPFSANYGDSNNDTIPDLVVNYGPTFITIQSQGQPNHPVATFPNTNNPNTIQVKNYTFQIPVNATIAAIPTSLPMGNTGVALNGVPFYNAYNSDGDIAVEGMDEEWFDSCCGHPDVSGAYHYHKYPRCVKSPFTDRGDTHSPILGFAWDGFAVHGPYESNGLLAMDAVSNPLDNCNGHSDVERGYHYHVSPDTFPYLWGGYRGTPEISNNPMLTIGDGNIADLPDPTDPSPWEGVIQTIAPSQLDAGTTTQVTITLNTVGAMPPVPPATPIAIHIGPYVGANIQRTGTTLTCDVTVDSAASLNLFDVHIQFTPPMGPNPPVYRKSNAVLVVPEAAPTAAGQWTMY